MSEIPKRIIWKASYVLVPIGSVALFIYVGVPTSAKFISDLFLILSVFPFGLWGGIICGIVILEESNKKVIK